MNAIIKKEIRTYFMSMTAYIYLGFFVLMSGLFFVLYNIDSGSPYFADTLSGSSILFLILIPTLTMRLFAEEARQKTDQLLFTSPLKVHQVVLGKYMAAFMLYLLSIVLLCVFPIILSNYTEVNIMETAGAIIGFVLLGACFIAVGLFVSSLTDNQIIAAVATFAALFLFFIMDSISLSMPTDRISSGAFIGAILLMIAFYVYNSTKNIAAGVIFGGVSGIIAVVMRFLNPMLYDGVITKVLDWFCVLTRFSSFGTGIIKLSDVVYYITFIAVFLYLTINVIERRRWK